MQILFHLFYVESTVVFLAGGGIYYIGGKLCEGTSDLVCLLVWACDGTELVGVCVGTYFVCCVVVSQVNIVALISCF